MLSIQVILLFMQPKVIQSNANPDTNGHRPFTVSEYFEQTTTVRRIGMIAGPNLSHEIHQGLVFGAVIGSRFNEVITIGKELFSSIDSKYLAATTY